VKFLRFAFFHGAPASDTQITANFAVAANAAPADEP
jgi:hypothetical protein